MSVLPLPPSEESKFLFYCNFLIYRSPFFFRTAPIAVPPPLSVDPPYSLGDRGAPMNTLTMFANEGILSLARVVIRSDFKKLVEPPLLNLVRSVRSSIDLFKNLMKILNQSYFSIL